MAETITLTTPSTFQNDSSAVAATAANNAAITTAFQDVLSLSGVTPNQMGSNLDMNSNQILNLPSPATMSSPARLQDVVTNPTISVPPVGTSGATVPLLNANNTFSGNTTFSGTVTISGNGVALQGGNNTFTGTNTFSNNNAFNGNNSFAGNNTHSGSETFSGTVSLPAATIANSNLTTMAAKSVKGNVSNVTGSVADLTQTQLTTLVNPFTSSLSGAVPASSGGTVNFLRADGTFTVPSSSSMVLLNTLTASNSATLSDTTSFTGTYSWYKLVFQNIIPATNQKILEFQVHSGGAFKSSGYIASVQQLGPTAIQDQVGTITTYIPISYPADTQVYSLGNAAPGLSGCLDVYTPSVSGLIMCSGTFPLLCSNGVTALMTTSGYWNSAGIVDGFQVLMDSGNITSGVIKIYGVV